MYLYIRVHAQHFAISDQMNNCYKFALVLRLNIILNTLWCNSTSLKSCSRMLYVDDLCGHFMMRITIKKRRNNKLKHANGIVLVHAIQMQMSLRMYFLLCASSSQTNKTFGKHTENYVIKSRKKKNWLGAHCLSRSRTTYLYVGKRTRKKNGKERKINLQIFELNNS